MIQINSKKLNIALVHLVSNGDVLYATTIAKQIKEIDFPDCHLTWVISNSCKSVLENNPYVDEIISINCTIQEATSNIWQSIKKDMLSKKEKGIYDHIFFTQLIPDNWHNFNGLLRPSLFNSYPFKIKIPINPVLVLSSKEILNVKNFVEQYQLNKYKNVILFECSPTSSQSFMNLNLALEVTKKVLETNVDTAIILSSPYTIENTDIRVIDGSKLSFRENAELTKYCNLLIGCSSGITWLSTSTAAKKLPMLQILNNDNEKIFASVEADFKYFNKDTTQIIEITKQDTNYIVDCINLILQKGILEAKIIFGEKLHYNIAPFFLFDTKFYRLFKEKKFIELFKVIKYYAIKRGVFTILFRMSKIILGSFRFKLKRHFMDSKR